MEDKYEFVDDDTVITHNGDILKRIRATRTIEGVIKKGDLGGYIGSPFNLSHSGRAWVSGNAVVSDEACVSGDARVSDRAWVYDNACVSDCARVSDNARVYVHGL